MATEKLKQISISGTAYTFIVSSAMTINNDAVHVNVRIHPDYEDRFSSLGNRSEILKDIAYKEAKSINNRAFFRFSNIDIGSEWQGQFDFD